MAPPTKKAMNRGAWTPEEDQKLAQCIETHGAKKWKTIAVKSGKTTLSSNFIAPTKYYLLLSSTYLQVKR